ncbi:MAG TPA: hypothetical protein VFT45_18325 [Longimicrobium sp.]|nr:hypothetical protein [Longimicrobium sp.]
MAEPETVEPGAVADTRLGRFLARSPLVGSREMSFVAGRAQDAAEVEALLTWLRTLGPGRWWSFGEWTDGMRLAEGLAGVRRPAPGDGAGDEARFVAGRWFGKRGDLEVWRDGPGFGWRWLGPPTVRPPGTAAVDFFGAGAGAVRLRRVAGRRALLWDRREARVATADGETMALLPMDGRMALRYVAYYDHGMVAAVWYRRIELLKEERNGA